MKDRIETEVVRVGEIERNVKLGQGGIREIEFLVQSQQLLHAGRQPFLQGAQTLPCLEKLAQYNLISGENACALEQAYCFLRDVSTGCRWRTTCRRTQSPPIRRPARGSPNSWVWLDH